MKFYINTNDGGSGQEFNTKEEFLKEIGLMIDDCIENGGTFFDANVDADASCFYIPEEDDNDDVNATPCDYGECPYNAQGGYDCRDYCGLGVDEAGE